MSGTWGGSRQGTGVIGEARAFDPVAGDGGTWRQVAAGFAQGRTGHSAFWTGTRMLVFGGATASGPSLDGALYDPASDTWANIGVAPLAARAGYSVVWSGTELWVWGGCEVTAPATKCFDMLSHEEPCTLSVDGYSGPFPGETLVAFVKGDEISVVANGPETTDASGRIRGQLNVVAKRSR